MPTWKIFPVIKRYACPPHRKIVAEYEKTVAQMIGELAPPSGCCLRGVTSYLTLAPILNKYLQIAVTLLNYFMRLFSLLLNKDDS